MADNFDLRQFMAENKIGPYIKTKVNEAKEWVVGKTYQDGIAKKVVPMGKDKVKVTFDTGETYTYEIAKDNPENWVQVDEMSDPTNPKDPWDVGIDTTAGVFENETYIRMDGMVHQGMLAQFKTSALALMQDLDDAGFDEQDIIDYLNDVLTDL